MEERVPPTEEWVLPPAGQLVAIEIVERRHLPDLLRYKPFKELTLAKGVGD